LSSIYFDLFLFLIVFCVDTIFMAREKGDVETIAKGVRFPLPLHDQVKELAKKQRRDFSKQVVFMIEQYIEYLPLMLDLEKQKEQQNTIHAQ